MVDRPALGDYFPEFKKRVNSVLWRATPGKQKVQYDNFQRRVEELQTMSEYNEKQAFVLAAKEFEILHPFFAQYDVREHDPTPGSHATIRHFGEKKDPQTILKDGDVTIEGHELTFRENLQWAMDAAGKHTRTKRYPSLCPNDTAWFLFEMACKEPDKFLMRVGQVEMKASDSDDGKVTSMASRRSIAELNSMLDELDYKPEERSVAQPRQDNPIEDVRGEEAEGQDEEREANGSGAGGQLRPLREEAGDREDQDGR
jgi:hypothetical protein